MDKRAPSRPAARTGTRPRPAGSTAAPALSKAPVAPGKPANPGLPPLVPGVKRSTWRMHDQKREAADAQYSRVRLDVLRRDGFACRYCGFTVNGNPEANPASLEASGYLEVHHKDDNHHNNAPANLVTVCPFCHQVFHAGNAGHRGAVIVVWCPWFTQQEVNLLSNVSAVAIARVSRYADAGRAWFRWMSSLQTQAAQVYGDAILDAANLGTALMVCANANSPGWKRRDQALAPLRLVPRRDVYETAVAWWSEHGWRPEAQWEAVLDQWSEACRT